MIYLYILIIPLMTATLIYLPPFRRYAAGFTVIGAAINLLLASTVIFYHSAIQHHTILAKALINWISTDGLSSLIVLLVTFIGTTAAIFSVGYMAYNSNSTKRLWIYYINFNLFLFSMLAVPLLTKPTMVWVAIELTTLTSVLLVSYENSREAFEAAWKYVALSLMGAGIALFGFLILFAAMESSGITVPYTWNGLTIAAPGMPPILLETAFLMILIGLGAKVGLVPMHTWLPDAHSQAPSPVCALLSGIETTVILYVILRIFPIMHAAHGVQLAGWALVIGLVSVGTAAFLLLQVRDYKRMFAFSTVEHMGIILIAAGLGTSIANYATMQQIVAHSITKSFCFFAAGAVLLTVGTRNIASVKGLWRKSPIAGAALFLGALGIAGAPPLALFLSEFSILKAALMHKCYLTGGLLILFIVIAFFGIMFHVNRMVFGVSEQMTDSQSVTKLPFSCRLAIIIAAVPVMLFGLYIPAPLHELLSQAAAVLTQ